MEVKKEIKMEIMDDEEFEIDSNNEDTASLEEFVTPDESASPNDADVTEWKKEQETSIE
ncbi:hypothetical protein C0J52_28017 [Blattella germanica]|nr:hypothetical protein C0J52_28017 [Blattella germanica]